MRSEFGMERLLAFHEREIGGEEEKEMEEGEEEETHNIDDLLESETKGEVDRFTVVEHRPLQADND